MSHAFVWTPENVALLHELLAKKIPRETIAERLGTTVGSVTGRCWRDSGGRSRRAVNHEYSKRRPAASSDARLPPPRAVAPQPAQSQPDQSQAARAQATQAQHAAPPVTQPRAVKAPPPPVSLPRDRINPPDGCQFPLWAAHERPTHRYCGEALEGRMYCAKHRQVTTVRVAAANVVSMR